MSELKARHIVDVYDSYYAENPFGERSLVYRKSEADKVIADLEESHKKEVGQLLIEIVELKKQVHDYAQGSYVMQARAEKEIRHHKYKQCLANAWWCEATALWCYQAANTLPAGFQATLYGKPVMIEPARLFKRSALLTKWSERWQKLAKKFKEAK
jgi:hypothetical protein